MRTLCRAVPIYLLGLPLLAGAADILSDNLSIQGFGTLGFARSSNKNADYVRDLSTPNGATQNFSARADTNFGLQLNYSFNDQFEAVVQGVSHYRYDASFSPELTWAFVKYTPNSNLALRLGRIGTEFYMAADSRMVGYSFLAVRPTVDFYGMLPFHYVDGVDARFSLPLADGVLRADIYSGRNAEKLPLQDLVWSLQGSRLSSSSIEYQKGPWMARYSVSRINFANELPIGALVTVLRNLGANAAADAMRVAGTTGTFRSLGGVYDDGTVQVHAALARTTRESGIFENDVSGYVLGGYRINQVTPYLGYSWVHSTPKPVSTGLSGPAFASLNALVAFNINNSHSDQNTRTFGARWDFTRKMDLKLQYDIQKGTAASVFPVRRENSDWDGSTKLISVALDFIF